MLTDISNNLRIHNDKNMNIRNNTKYSTQRVSRSKRNVNDENHSQVYPNSNNTKRSSHLTNSKYTGSSTVVKMTEAPTYKFSKIYQQKTDILFPFYKCPIETEHQFLKNQEEKLDFTTDVMFYKNHIKKYSKPIQVVPSTNALTPKKSSNIFYGFNTSSNSNDPIMETLLHMNNENKLRFGDFMITINKNGSSQMDFSPRTEEEEFIIKNRRLESSVKYNKVEEEEEEILYKSDENEISKLEVSDLEITEAEESDSDIEIDLNLDIDFENDIDLSILESSLVSQGIQPEHNMDNLHDGFLTNERKMIKNLPNGLSMSPVKKIMINKMKQSSTSPQKMNSLFRTLKNKSSPIKALNTQRSGINLTPISKPIRKTKHNHHGNNNYSKFDNSMTISAKAIMKMVDDSLVSSDTEIFNNSYSYIAMKSFNRGNNQSQVHSQHNNDDISINAADLMSALNDVGESPLTLRLKELKL